MFADDARLSELMRRGRHGDRDAYRLFLAELAGRLCRQLRCRIPLLGEADVDDLVQEILISVHSSRAAWDEARPILPWIAAVARYRVADHFRKRGRSRRLAEEMSRMVETYSTVPPNNSWEEVVNELSMEHALAELSVTERRAFTLVRLHGLTVDEAAISSGSTAAALKVAAHRAARKLQTLFREGRL